MPNPSSDRAPPSQDHRRHAEGKRGPPRPTHFTLYTFGVLTAYFSVLVRTLYPLSTIMVEQRWLRIIPVAFVMYTIAYIDRTNISQAMQAMIRDLHLSPSEAGSAVGVFFWGYMLLQIPGGYLASRWSAKNFVSILLVVWGICSMLTGFVHTGREFLVMRFVLGVAEGGVWPATLVLLASWFPRAERARANAYWMLCLPAAVVVASPLSGWLLAHWNWRVLLIVEGAFPILWLAIWVWFIVDHPAQAKWISQEELNYLETTLRSEASDVEPVTREPYLKTLFRPQVMLLIAIYLLLTSGNYGYLFWLPSALEKAQKMGSLKIGVLLTIPYAVTAVGMVLISQHSDRHRERRGHTSFGLAWGGAFLLASVLTSGSTPLLSFALISAVGAGSYAALGPFWAIPTETLRRNVAGSAIGLINAVGNLGGYFGPRVVGVLNERTGNFVYAFAALSAGYLIGAALCMLVRRSPKG